MPHHNLYLAPTSISIKRNTIRSRLTRALAIRDAALRGIQKHGTIISTSRLGKYHSWSVGDFELSYRTSLQKHENARRNDIIIPPDRILPHGLDIWDPRRKVLNIEWLESYRCEVANFRSGPWEEVFLQSIEDSLKCSHA
jgi:hypothetical protein